MTTEEKAKSYDEALERAREFQKSKDGLCVLTAESIFPELQKSEDEKIRKALVDALNKNLGNGIEKYGTTLNAALAWLEKQGEQKKTSDTKYEVKAGDSLSVNGKPFDYEHATITQKDFAPKQEWSEEDENMAEDLIKGCVSAEIKAHHFLHTPKEVSDWLKTIKERIKGKED